MAPEVIKQSGHDHKADIWSLGFTALALALREPPHSEPHPMKVLLLFPDSSDPSAITARQFQHCGQRLCE